MRKLPNYISGYKGRSRLMEWSLNDFEELQGCPWCGAVSHAGWCFDPPPFHTVQCLECDLVFVKRRLNKAGREKFYLEYNSDKHQAGGDLRDLRHAMYLLDAEFVTKYISSGKVLDVGCGGGFFLDVFDDTRFDKYGIEFGLDGFEVASEKYPGKIRHGELTDQTFNEHFDLVMFRGVIEHLVNPKECLSIAANLLRPGGFLFITATPNLKSFCADLFRENFNQHLPDEHIIGLSDRHLKDFLPTLGLQLSGQQAFYLETPYANLEEDAKKIQDALRIRASGQRIKFKSPPWFDNMMTLIFQKRDP